MAALNTQMTPELRAMKPIQRMKARWDFMWSSIIQLSLLGLFFGVVWDFVPAATTTPGPRPPGPKGQFHMPSAIFYFAKLMPGGIHAYASLVLVTSVVMLMAFIVKTKAALVAIIVSSFVLFLTSLVMLDGCLRAVDHTGGVGLTVGGFFLMVSGRYFHVFQALVRRWKFLTRS